MTLPKWIVVLLFLSLVLAPAGYVVSQPQVVAPVIESPKPVVVTTPIPELRIFDLGPACVYTYGSAMQVVRKATLHRFDGATCPGLEQKPEAGQ